MAKDPKATTPRGSPPDRDKPGRGTGGERPRAGDRSSGEQMRPDVGQPAAPPGLGGHPPRPWGRQRTADRAGRPETRGPGNSHRSRVPVPVAAPVTGGACRSGGANRG